MIGFANYLGNFTAPDESNLILNRLSRLDVLNITPDGLRLVKELPILGRVNILQSFRPENSQKDYIFALTHKLHAMVLELTNENGVFRAITLASGKISDKPDRQIETGCQCSIDPTSTWVAMHIFQGLINISKLDLKGKDIRTFNVRVEETCIQDFTFLLRSGTPTLCFIHQEANARHLKTYEVSTSQDMKRGPWKQDNVESESHFLIPVDEPFGGVIIIGQESITHVVGDNDYTAVTDICVNQSTFTCYCKIDAGRYVIGDMLGRLFLLALSEKPAKPVTNSHAEKYNITMFHLGWTTIPKCICYIDNYHFYIGSRFGDSQLVKISTDGTEGSCVEIVDTYSSLAPILDMMVLDLDKQGQDQLVTCSGFQKEGSLRIIRNGIGINELASVDIQDVNNVWRLRVDSPEYDNIIVLAYINATRLLKLVGEDIESFEITDFELDECTLYCSNLSDQLILQVLPSGIRLISTESGGKLVSRWKSDDPTTSLLTLVSVHESQILCSSGAVLFYLEVIGDKLVQISTKTLENEVACLDISPISDGKSEYCAVSNWKNITLRFVLFLFFECLRLMFSLTT